VAQPGRPQKGPPRCLDGRRGWGGRDRLWSSGLEVEGVGHRLIELELRHRLGQGGVEPGRGIRRIGEEVDLGGPRAGDRGGGRWGRPSPHAMHALRGDPDSRWRRMALTTGGSVKNARIFIWPPHAGHTWPTATLGAGTRVNSPATFPRASCAAEESGHRAYERVERPAAAVVQPGRSPPGDRSLVVAGSMATAPRAWSQAPEPLAGPSRMETAGGGPGVERGRLSGRLTRPAMRCGRAAPRSSRSPCRRLPLRGRAGTRWARPTR